MLFTVKSPLFICDFVVRYLQTAQSMRVPHFLSRFKNRRFSKQIGFDTKIKGYYLASDHPYKIVGNWNEWLETLMNDKMISDKDNTYVVDIIFPNKTPLLFGGAKVRKLELNEITFISEYFAVFNKKIKIVGKTKIKF